MPPAQPVADSEPVIVVGDDGGDALSYRRLIQSFEPGTKLYLHAQPAVSGFAVDGAPAENHIGSKNALDAIVSFIKSKSNPTVKCYEGVSEQLFKDNCHGIHSHVIEYILKLGEELEDLRAEQDEVQPAPVFPDFDNVLESLDYEARCNAWESEHVLKACQATYDACRAAMLQAGTLNNEGTKQAWTGIPDIDNAINMLDRIDTLDSCDDDRIEAVKTVLRRLAGNSPVIPDGYVMVPKEMTDEIGEAIAMQANCCGGIALDIYDAMIAAAPHDTPALNSVQSVVHVSDGWIPVSERMPEDDDFVYIWPRPDFGVELHIGQYCERNHKGGGWYAQVYEQNYGIEWHPITVTHWMPLPAGPQGVKGE
ncbi:DUF551 domain-containing protein [Klebsiella quasipneumoniae]|uniref:DUF551 domain-containing protein n=1 Tax=Klebsiella quasipneumoniae TaxID=1463165 RepID=UPI00352A8A12